MKRHSVTLAQWPRRRLVLLWLLGAALYGTLFVADAIQRRKQESAFQARWGSVIGPGMLAGDTLSSARRDSLTALAFAVIRAANRGARAQSDSVLAQMSAIARRASAPLDSLSRVFQAPAQLSSAQDDSLKALMDSMIRPITASLATMTQDVAWRLYVALFLVISPAAALVVTTIIWLLSHRRQDVIAHVADDLKTRTPTQ